MSNRLRNRSRDQRGVLAARVTLADVARQASVSTSTASRALNGRGELAPDTRAAVLQAAEALGFRPSSLARSLRTQRTFTIGLIVPDVAHPFYGAALKGAQRVLEDGGYGVMLMDSGHDPRREEAAVHTLVDHHVDGLLVATSGLSADRFDAVVAGHGTPFVFFDDILPGRGAGSVAVENGAGIALLVQHLVEHGHTRIGLLAGPPQEGSGQERADGFHAALGAAGLHAPPAHVRVCAWTLASGQAEARRLLAGDDRPTAVVASSAELALGCLAASRDLGLLLPRDLALAAFDDPYYGALLEPSLTAVAYDPEHIGAQAAEILVAELAGAPVGDRERRVAVRLVRRRSCGCEPGTGGAE